jgi:hypothetical protein
MDSTSVETFFGLVKGSPQLTERLQAAATVDQFASLAAEVAQELGLAITPAEFTSAIQKLEVSGGTELTDEELRSAAGGAYMTFGGQTYVSGGCGANSLQKFSSYCTHSARCE